MTSSFNLQKAGGWAALICAITYIIGFVILISVLASFGYGTDEIDANAVVKYISENPHALIFFNTTIYILNAIALAILVLSLSEFIEINTPAIASLAKAFGIMWATLVLGAGMIGNVAAEAAYHQFSIDPVAAAETWKTMHKIEIGLGGGNEIAGGLWFACAGIGLLKQDSFNQFLSVCAIIVGVSGLLTVWPILGDIMGAVFGIGALLWFLMTAIFVFNQTHKGR